MYLTIDVQTLEIRAIEVADNDVGDVSLLLALLEQIAKEASRLSVSVERAYYTKACHEAICQRGAQAFIPPRKMPSLGKRASQQKRRYVKKLSGSASARD